MEVFFFYEFRKALCQTAATTIASKCQHSTFPHTHLLQKARKTGMPLPNRNSRVSRCSEAMRPSGSLTQPSQSAAVLPKSSGTTQPLPSHNQQLEHMLDTSMTLRRQDYKITECSNKEKTCNTCKKALRSNSHPRVTTSNTSICSKPV